MPNRHLVVRKGIKGLDPNEKEEPQLNKWLAEHQGYDADLRKQAGESLKAYRGKR